MNCLAFLVYMCQWGMDVVTHNGIGKLNAITLSKFLEVLGLAEMKKL